MTGNPRKYYIFILQIAFRSPVCSPSFPLMPQALADVPDTASPILRDARFQSFQTIPQIACLGLGAVEFMSNLAHLAAKIIKHSADIRPTSAGDSPSTDGDGSKV